MKAPPKLQKTDIGTHHLDNRTENAEVDVTFCGMKVENVRYPKYLGVTFDRTITFKKHLQRCKENIKAQVNLIQKLVRTSWGAGANTLRTATLALIYSMAEYCMSVWSTSAHTKAIDIQLNAAMRTVSGTFKMTKTEWLPILCNIALPAICRDVPSSRYFSQILATKIPAQRLPTEHQHCHFKSQNPPWNCHSFIVHVKNGQIRGHCIVPQKRVLWNQNWHIHHHA